MRPRPITPSTFPRSSTPRSDFFSHLLFFICASARGIDRADEIMSANACSATLMLFAPGAFRTRMPLSLAACRSTLSTPEPARAMTRSCGAEAISCEVTLVALRTMSASASAMSFASSSAGRPERASTVQPSVSKSLVADVGGRKKAAATTLERESLV